MQHGSTKPTLLDFARLYAHRELRVLPLHSFKLEGGCTCGNPRCPSPGKHPRTKDAALSATTNPAQLTDWWDRFPQANVGIATGEGLLVIDIDPRHGGALEALRRLVELPEKMPLVRTGGGGWHLYFRHEKGLIVPNANGRLAEGIDTRGHHGYVVAPPSLHVSGKRYCWDALGKFPPAPNLLLELALNPRRAGASAAPTSAHVVILPQQLALSNATPAQKATPAEAASALRMFVVPEGKRHDKLVSLAGSLCHQGAGGEVMLGMLRTFNQAYCSPALPDEEVCQIVRSTDAWSLGEEPVPTGLGDLTALVTLMSRETPEPRWAIPGLLPEGMTLLAGKPKLGKSWLALSLALSVAAGDPALGKLPARAGHVLYLGLEDTERRMKDRSFKLLQGRQAPYEFTWGGWWRSLAQGGLDDLEHWLHATKDARLIVIDTLARARTSVGSNGSVYAEDYAAITPLKQLAEQYRVSILVIHHLRKSASTSDPMDEISGSTGLTGATDCNMVLQRERGEMTARLFVTGRDVDEQQLALTFDEETASWSLAKETGPKLAPTSRAILDLLQEQGEAMSPLAIAQELGLDRGYIRKMLHSLKGKGLVYTSERGLYLLNVHDDTLWAV